MCVAVIVVVGGMTSLNLALPDIGRQLGAGQSDLQWVVDGYTLVLAALVLPCGALGDRFGRKWALLGGLGLLLGTLVWAASAASVGQLLAARCVGGAGAALVFPGTLATITTVYPAERRGRAVALWSASAIVGGLLGLVLSGGLVELFWWGSIFLATAGAVAVTIVIIAAAVPNTSDPDHAHLDPGGSLLSIAAAGGLVLAITEGPVRGWSHGLTVTAAVIGLAGAAGFAAWELRTARPLLDVRLFSHPGFTAGSLSIFVQMFSVFGLLFLSVQYLATMLGYSPVAAGCGILALGVLMIPGALIGDPLAKRFGRARVSGFGLAALVPGLVILAFMTSQSSYWHLAAGLALFGGGIGVAVVPATEAIVEALPPAKQGVASAMNDVAREFGGAVGIAAAGSAFNGAYRSRMAGLRGSLAPELVDIARDSPLAGLKVAAGLGAGGEGLITAVRDAFLHGWTVAMVVMAAVAALGALLVAIRTPKGDRAVSGTAGPAGPDERAAPARAKGA